MKKLIRRTQRKSQQQISHAQLVYLHCEKAAGTSQWALLYRIYGEKDIFRNDTDRQLLKGRKLGELIEYRVLGGHISFGDFAQAKQRILFASVVRDPVARAVSLYHYFREGSREEDKETWLKMGLDPNSMLNTIRRVPAFRDRIHNMQCYRVSGKRTFSEAKHALEGNNFIVGNFDALDEFNSRLGDLLNWDETSLGQHNTAKRANYQDEILREEGLHETIHSLNQEDAKLFEFVRKRGVFENIPDAALFREHLQPKTTTSGPTLEWNAPIEASISILEPRLSVGPGRASVRATLTNEGRVPLEAGGEHPILIGYHWYDLSGRMLEWEGFRTPLPRHVFPGESIGLDLTVVPAETLPPGQYTIQFDLLRLRDRWIGSANDRSSTVRVTLVE